MSKIIAKFKVRDGKVTASRDEFKKVGLDASVSDAYLFNAADFPEVGARIRATGYDPDTADAAQTAKTKKLCKSERAIGKVFTLAGNYKARPPKLQSILKTQAGVNLPLRTVEQMWAAYWRKYAGVADYDKELVRQWTRNKGWVLNGIGRPLGACEDKVKDLVNTVCQSTGHDILVKLVLITADLLDEAGLDWHPWVMDLHDASYIEVREDQAEIAKDLMQNKAYAILNEWLGGLIPLRGEAKVLNNWGEAVE